MFVPVSVEDGLLEDSVVNCDRLVTVRKEDLEDFLTALSEDKLASVAAAVRFALDLDD